MSAKVDQHQPAAPTKTTTTTAPVATVGAASPEAGLPAGAAPLVRLQRLAGNRTTAAQVRREATAGGPIGAAGGPVPDDLARRIDAARGGGRPVDTGLGRRVGRVTGTDLGGVRVHTDGEADTLSRSLSARAFTTGTDIFFRRGTYRPGSADGDRLIAHELAHVGQQAGGGVARSAALTVGAADDRHEADADRVADQVARAHDAGTDPRDTDRPAGEPGAVGAGRVAPAGVSRMIQRSVGYEFETNYKVERANTGLKKTFGGAYRPLKKMELIQDYTEGMRMEADENSTLGSTIEFVIDPPVKETEGLRLEAILQRLDAVADNISQAPNGVPVNLDTLTHNPAHADVRVTAQGALTANPQVTGGIGLDKIMTLLTEMGGGHGNAPAGHKNAAKELDNMSPGAGMQMANRGNTVVGSDALKALVAFTASYINFGSKRSADYPPMNYTKLVSNSVLVRTDFGAMFQKLGTVERQQYENNPDQFVTLVMNAAAPVNTSADLPVIERGVRQSYRQGSKGYNKLVRNGATRLTRREWLTAITTGVDLLSSHHMPKLAKDLEGLGALGPTTDKVGGENAPNNPLGAKDRGSGIVMEFRNMRKNVAWTKWHSLAADTFDYITELNAR